MDVCRDHQAYNPKAVLAIRVALETLLEEHGEEGIVNVEILNAAHGSLKLRFSAVFAEPEQR
jgi:hypothetical protein